MLTMVIPLYISEVSSSDIRGGLVVLQQRELGQVPSLGRDVLKVNSIHYNRYPRKLLDRLRNTLHRWHPLLTIRPLHWRNSVLAII